MTVEQIAKKHGVSAEKIRAELAMGIAVEKEHVDAIAERRAYALDHLEEIPDYYTRLKAMEEKAKKDEKDDRKEMEGLTDGEAEKAFDKWKDLGEKWDAPVAANTGKDSETHYPSVSLKVGKDAGALKVGEEMEIEFKACVESVEKTKDGVRVRLELKEAKFS